MIYAVLAIAAAYCASTHLDSKSTSSAKARVCELIRAGVTNVSEIEPSGMLECWRSHAQKVATHSV